MKCLGYETVSSLGEAMAFLREHPSCTVPVAGGTDLMVKARSRDWYRETWLLDISGIPELYGIQKQEERLEIGACETAAHILKSDPVCKYAPILAESCLNLAGPQVRNRATIGGNLANGCLAGDMIPALCVLDAELVIESPSGRRVLNVNELLREARACLKHEEMTVSGCYFGCPAGKKTNLAPDELITKVRIPLRAEMAQSGSMRSGIAESVPVIPGTVHRFIKVGIKQTGCMSKFTFACMLRMEERKIADLRLAVGAAFSGISVRTEVCRALIGTEGTEQEVASAANALGDAIEAQVRVADENIRYRAEVCRRLTKRTLLEMVREGNA